MRDFLVTLPAANIYVECKNYEGEVANPELDQISGRFSPTRGKVGLLVCRKFDDKERFIAGCRDTAQDDRGFVIPLDDDDLQDLVEHVQSSTDTIPRFEFLMERFQRLIS